MTREEALDALRNRVAEAMAVLEGRSQPGPEAALFDEAARSMAAQLATNARLDGEARFVLGLYHWSRHLVTLDGDSPHPVRGHGTHTHTRTTPDQPDDESDLEAAVRCLQPVYAVESRMVPSALHPLLAASVELSPDQGAAYELPDPIRQTISGLERYRHSADPADLSAVIGALTSFATPARRATRALLADCLYNRAVRLGELTGSPAAEATAEAAEATPEATADKAPSDSAPVVEAIGLAVSAYRSLAEEDPAHLPDLAMALHTQAVDLTTARRFAQAVESEREAAGIYRALADDNDDYLADLATSLGGVAHRSYLAFGAAQAVEPARQAVDACRRLPDGGRPDLQIMLGDALGTLVGCLAEAGLAAEATAAAEEAAELHTDLGAQADALNDLSNRYAEQGRWAEALEAAERSESIRRGLPLDTAEDRADLAMVLTNLSNRLGDLARPVDALGPAREAVALYRELADGSASPDVALSLNNLSIWLSDAGRHAEALAAAQEAADIYRRVAATSPRHRPQLAAALNNLSNRLVEAALPQEAEGVIAEAVTIRRELVAKEPHAHRADLAGSLNNWANRLFDTGRGVQGLAVVGEAVRTYHELATEDPRAYGGDLAIALDTAALCLESAGRHDEAVVAASESVTAYRTLSAEAPGAYRGRLAFALANLGARLLAAGRYPEAAEAYREAGDSPQAGRLVQVQAARGLGAALHSAGRSADALAAYQKAVDSLPLASARASLRRDRELGLGRLAGLGPDAAAAAIACGELPRAIEFLERARGVIAADRLDVRGDLRRLRRVDAPTADTLVALRDQIDALTHAALDPADGDPATAGGAARFDETLRQVNADRLARLDARFTALVTGVGTRKGFETFLRPPSFEELASAAAYGPVVIVNVSRYACHALLLTHGGRAPTEGPPARHHLRRHRPAGRPPGDRGPAGVHSRPRPRGASPGAADGGRGSALALGPGRPTGPRRAGPLPGASGADAGGTAHLVVSHRAYVLAARPGRRRPHRRRPHGCRRQAGGATGPAQRAGVRGVEPRPDGGRPGARPDTGEPGAGAAPRAIRTRPRAPSGGGPRRRPGARSRGGRFARPGGGRGAGAHHAAPRRAAADRAGRDAGPGGRGDPPPRHRPLRLPRSQPSQRPFAEPDDARGRPADRARRRPTATSACHAGLPVRMPHRGPRRLAARRVHPPRRVPAPCRLPACHRYVVARGRPAGTSARRALLRRPDPA
nr:tetratricopeptide repeat protein [Streptomyces sp. TRM49041]